MKRKHCGPCQKKNRRGFLPLLLHYQEPHLGHLLHSVAQALASEAAVLDAAVGHVVHAPGGDVPEDHSAHLEGVEGFQAPLQIPPH